MKQQFRMGAVNELEALEYSIEEKKEKQTDRFDLYVKIIFSILPKQKSNKKNETEPDFFNSADNIQLNIIKNEIPKDAILFDSNHTTIIINCEDLLASELGYCNDSIGLYLKTLEAIQLAYEYLSSKVDLELANVHFALYSFEYNRDLIDGFSFLVDKESELNVSLEEYASYIINTEDCFQNFIDRNWFLYIDYIGIYDYYQLFQPVLKGNVEKNELISEFSPDHSNSHDSKTESAIIEDNYSDAGEIYSSDLIIQGHVEYNHILARDWLSDVQTGIDFIGVIPGAGEVSSLVNGFIYLGRLTKACYDWDDAKINAYRREALLSFAGAIPGASIVKGAVKVMRAGRAIRTVTHTERILAQSRSTQRRAQQTLNRLKNKKTSISKKKSAKQNKLNSDTEVNNNKQNLNDAITQRNLRVEETGLTIGQLNEVSAGFLANPRKYYRAVMDTTDNVMKGRVPITQIDTLIDTAFEVPENFGHLRDGFRKIQEGNYDGAVLDFMSVNLSIFNTGIKLDEPDLTDFLDTNKKLYDKYIELINEQNNIGDES